MKKVLFGLALAATSAMALSASRVGPVSQYGELQATVLSNKGQLVGSCPDYSEKAVQVKGMSLFWSSAADSATAFYTEKAVNLMVKDMNIEILRFAMGVKSSFDRGRGYLTGGEDLQKAYLKNVVSAAIDNDIYVIIDWHIEDTQGYTEDAVKFFEYAAKEYGSYNNVIFEVWNEPENTSVQMSTVAEHANKVIKAIRDAGSDNLVLIGSPRWSSHPEQCAAASISDPKNNYACTLHFYAATHGNNDGNGEYAKLATEAMNLGVPVFASEWGTVTADGNGGANQGESQSWVNWMATNHVSWANWSASAEPEGSAAFKQLNLDQGLVYSESGTMVKGFLGSAQTYTDCHLQNGSSSAESEFSKGVANGEITDIVDDMEDGDRFAYTGGWWSAFADSDDDTDGRGKTTISNPKYKNGFGLEVYDVLMPVKSDDAKNTSKYMVGIEDIYLARGAYKHAPYVAIGLNLKKDTSEIDLSQCTSISYKFKGAAHNFRVETSPITNWNFHHVAKDGSEGWKEVELTWDQFTQEDWGDNDKHFNLGSGMNKVKRFAWEVKGVLDLPDAKNQPAYNYLYVDDVRCNGASIVAISGSDPVEFSSNSVNKSSSSAGKSSSSGSVVNFSSSVQPSISSSSAAVLPTEVIVIDDVEDGDEVLKTGGTWYAYTDKEPGGLSSIMNVYDATLPGYVVNFLGTVDPTNGTQGFVGLNGIHWNQGTYTEAPFVALGANLMADTSMGYDMSQCTAISYRYRGATHVFKVQDGSVTDYAYHQLRVDSASVWTKVVATWDKLEQPSWTQDPKDLNHASIKKFAWEVVGYKGLADEQPELDYLYVDDVECITSSVAIAKVSAPRSAISISAQGRDLNVTLPSSGFVKVQIFDMMGQLVESHAENRSAGMHSISLAGLRCGNYVVRVVNGTSHKAVRISIR